jgi:hypothetical protein
VRLRAASRLAGALLALFLGGTLSAPASAQGLKLAWQDCRAPDGAGFTSQAFGCQSVITEFPLFPSFTLATLVDSVYAAELVIDVDVDADPLPEWWRMDPGQCRANGWRADAAPLSACADAWEGNGTAAFQGWLPGTPGSSGRHGRLLIAASVFSEDAVALQPFTAYAACRVVLRTNATLDCPGCDVPACLVFNSILLRRLPGSSVEEVFLGEAASPGENMVIWQSPNGPNCLSVPVRRSTWGAVKALYR